MAVTRDCARIQGVGGEPGSKRDARLEVLACMIDTDELSVTMLPHKLLKVRRFSGRMAAVTDMDVAKTSFPDDGIFVPCFLCYATGKVFRCYLRTSVCRSRPRSPEDCR